jgi:hypothetical protein
MNHIIPGYKTPYKDKKLTIEWCSTKTVLVSIPGETGKVFYLLPVEEVLLSEYNLTQARYTSHGAKPDLLEVITLYESLTPYRTTLEESMEGDFLTLRHLSTLKAFIDYTYDGRETTHEVVLNTSVSRSQLLDTLNVPALFWASAEVNNLLNSIVMLETSARPSDLLGLVRTYLTIYYDTKARALLKESGVILKPLSTVVPAVTTRDEVNPELLQTEDALNARLYRELPEENLDGIGFWVKGIDGSPVLYYRGPTPLNVAEGIDTGVFSHAPSEEVVTVFDQLSSRPTLALDCL